MVAQKQMFYFYIKKQKKAGRELYDLLTCGLLFFIRLDCDTVFYNVGHVKVFVCNNKVSLFSLFYASQSLPFADMLCRGQ